MSIDLSKYSPKSCLISEIKKIGEPLIYLEEFTSNSNSYYYFNENEYKEYFLSWNAITQYGKCRKSYILKPHTQIEPLKIQNPRFIILKYYPQNIWSVPDLSFYKKKENELISKFEEAFNCQLKNNEPYGI